MNRTRMLQEIRMLRFEDVHDRFRQGRLSACEAAEWLGVSERTFRRQRVRFEEEGLSGLLDRRLGRASPHRVPVERPTPLVVYADPGRGSPPDPYPPRRSVLN